MGNRDDNGVRLRMDGKGDPWANLHRTHTVPGAYLQDVDGFIGHIEIAKNCQDKLFKEYVCDSIVNRGQRIRNFGYTALFDRKQSENIAEQSTLSTAVYLDFCRKLSQGQPIPVRFFFVIGPDEGSWRLAELSIETGIELNSNELTTSEKWVNLWKSLGLLAAREELSNWLLKKDISPALSINNANETSLLNRILKIAK